MTRIARLVERLSLRQRFLVGPLLGLALLSALAVAFSYELQHATRLLKRLDGGDVAAYDRYSEVFVKLSDQHMALLDLLHGAQRVDEELYDAEKQRLDRIYQAVSDLERTLPAVAAAPEATERLAARRRSLLLSTVEYRNAASSAVTMTAISLSLRREQIARLNETFAAMEHAFAGFLQAERVELRSEVSAQIGYGEASGAVIMIGGVSAALLLVALALGLAKLLSRSLETQIEALTELGARAGTRVPIEGSNEIERIAHAIAAFRQSLLRLQDSERALSTSNASLTEALQEVRQAQTQLEQRVNARTRELRAANEELSSEVVQRREAERHLRIYAEVIRRTGEAVAITDDSGTLIEVNPAYEDALGRPREELIGTRLYPIEPGGENEALHRELWRAVEANGHWTGEVLGCRGNGETFPSWVLINTLRDDSGTPTHYVCVSRDITALKRSEEQLQRLAFYDGLTRLPNRALFNDRLRVALAGAERQRDLIAVMYLDLDGFKEVNDTLGHAAGDGVLIEIGERIGRCIRASDTLARTGGDEFTILLARAGSTSDVTLIAERIVEAVAMPIQAGGQTVKVGTSIGISFYPNDGVDAETLQMKADLAMYKAKKAGRGQYRVFEGESAARGKERFSLTAELEAAIAGDQFVVFYQPIVNASSGRVERAEALLRWRKPGHGLTLPETFLPHAEQCGLVRKIDAWVLERACSDARKWLGENCGPSLCVNLSAVSLQQPNVVKTVAGVLERTGLAPRLLTLEVTESALLRDPHAARDTLEAIDALGVGLALDDFGTGHSSLSYLARFPLDCIKLDLALVDGIGKDAASEQLIRTLLALAERLKLRIVAEGVEHEDQQQFLSALGCELMQGYRFVRPMPGDMLPDWLASNGQSWLLKTKRSQGSGANGARGP